MNNPLTHITVKSQAKRAARRHARSGGLLDVRFGFALFRDKSVPLSRKVIATIVGISITAVLVALELPVEAAVTALLNLIGFGLDVILDGMEAAVCPIIIACLLLPYMLGNELRLAKRTDYLCPK